MAYFLRTIIRSFPSTGLKSLPAVLRRIAYPVEPFDFKFVQNGLLPPLLEGQRDRLGKQPGCLTNKKVVRQMSFSVFISDN